MRCSACGGTGVYDYTGSPKCGACGGTGQIQEDFEDKIDVLSTENENLRKQLEIAIAALERVSSPIGYNAIDDIKELEGEK